MDNHRFIKIIINREWNMDQIAAMRTFIKVVAWYDNEWGYSNKCLEMVRVVTAK